MIQNTIMNSHENGIKVTCTHRSCEPLIWRNIIENNSANGILCQGDKCTADIRGNIINLNRKVGIKVTEFAKAEIRGIKKQGDPLDHLINTAEFKNKLENIQVFSSEKR